MVLPFLVPRVRQPVVAQCLLLLSLFQNAQISSCRGLGVSSCCGQVGMIGKVSLEPILGSWAWLEPKERYFSFDKYLLSSYFAVSPGMAHNERGRHKSLPFWGWHASGGDRYK